MAELIWDGKYDEHGNKRAPVRIELPFQTVETVNESAQERQRTLELSSSGNDPEWRNRLIWGDKKYVLPSLLPEFAGKVDLIYIDPPFDTGADFSFSTMLPDSEDMLTKEPSVLEQKAYRDTWGKGLDSYLPWFHETVVLLREFLHDSGSLYVHLDWHVGHYARAVLDEVFSSENFVNDITWYYYNKFAPVSRCFPRASDRIMVYAKSFGNHTFNKQEETRDVAVKQLKRKFIGGKAINVRDESGVVQYQEKTTRRVDDVWRISMLQPADHEENLRFPTQKPERLLDRIIKASSNEHSLVLDCFCGSGTTAAVAEKLNRRWIACDLGRFAIHTTRKRLLGIPGVKPFVVQNLGKYERQAWQVAEFAPSPSTVILSGESASHGEARTESKDPMSAGNQQRPGKEFSETHSGHGENSSMGRKSLQPGKGSFDSRNRFASGSRSSDQDDSALREQREREANYRKFILELYHATPVSGHVWLHGVKGGRMVHIGAVDAPVTRADVNAIAAEVWKSKSAEKPAVDILGWEFALELNETAKEVAAQARVDAAFKKIPREVLEKKAVEQGDVHFFELGALSVETKIKKRELTLKLSDFVIPLDDVPEEVRGAIKHWSQMVDYWAVDWDFKDDTFHNQWQSYRTRKNPKLELSVAHEYSEPGNYMVVVKVIDILGNDTTKTLQLDIK